MKHASSPMRLFSAVFAAALIFTLAAGSGSAAPQGQRGGGGRGQRPASAMDSTPKVFDTAEYKIRVVTFAEGLSYPYCFTFLPDGSMLLQPTQKGLALIASAPRKP